MGAPITIYRKIAALTLFLATAGLVCAPATAIENAPIPIADLFREALARDVIAREQFLEQKEGTAVFGKAHFKSAGEYARHEKRFRIIAAPHEDNISALYYLFTNNKNIFRRLKEGDVLEFHGKLVITTPTNLNKNAFIFDIVLDE